MKTRYDFKEDLKNDVFELYFVEWLNNYVHLKPEDKEVSQGYFPQWDVRTPHATYEIKRDYVYESTKNLLVEIWYNKEEDKLGWINHITADWLVIFITDYQFYMVKMSDVFVKLASPIWDVKEIEQSEGFHTVNWVANRFTNFDTISHKIPRSWVKRLENERRDDNKGNNY